MNSFVRFALECKEYLRLPIYKYDAGPRRIYETCFNWITDPTQSPESILHVLDTYLSRLNGFSTNWSLQTMVAFASLEALAIRRPDALEGPWERVALTIAKYSKYSNDTKLINCKFTKAMALVWTRFRTTEQATLKWIIEYSSPHLCPNPCLRLELFRLMRGFGYDAGKVEYDRKSHSDKVLSTLCELHDKYSTFTVDHVPMCNAIDLADIIMDNSFSLGGLTLNDNPDVKHIEIMCKKMTMSEYMAANRNPTLSLQESVRKAREQVTTMQNNSISTRRGKITPKENINAIAAVIKVSTMMVLLENDRYRNFQVQPDIDRDHFIFTMQINMCVSFCGLIHMYNDGFSEHVKDFVKTVSSNPLLLTLVSNNITAITIATSSLRKFKGEGPLFDCIIVRRDRLLYLFFRKCIRTLPMNQHLRELNGGFKPVTEYHIRSLFDSPQHTIVPTFSDSKNVDSEVYYLARD